MNKLLLASVATLSLAALSPSLAQDAGAAVGATGGGATGAVVGGLVGGPIGAIVGGFAGAVIGAEAGIEASTVEYVTAHPVEPVVIQGDLTIGAALPEGVTIHPIESDPDYGYIYANGRVWIVDLSNRTLVHSPGYVVSESATQYVVSNPVSPVSVEGDVVVGYVLPDSVEVAPVPESNFGYVYVNDRPVLVDSSTRTVIWVN